ncbi:MAG: hypothetical protein M3506_00440 [Chloroflexota bacterium]|nr:hypothetical protein [Chloroflexota bacterium]
MPVKHIFVSGVAEGADATKVRTSNWNAGHLFDLIVTLPTPGTGAGLALTNVGASYDAVALSQFLPFFEMYMDGIDTVVLTVRANKIGTGTQSYQLWNETDATSLAVVSDAGAAGTKYITTTVTGVALTGLKRFRLRANSTVATDDPVLYGASVILRATV